MAPESASAICSAEHLFLLGGGAFWAAPDLTMPHLAYTIRTVTLANDRPMRWGLTTMIDLYQTDFHAWTQQQAHLLKAGQLADADLTHLIEELESMGASERHQLQNRLKVLLAHLLKWQYQPEYRSRSWRATIKEQRLSLLDLLDDNPSLKAILDARVAKAYPMAVLLAVRETNLDEATFPTECPYALTQILQIEAYPESADSPD